MSQGFEGRVVVVSVAARSFGLAVSNAFASAGARVAAVDLRPGDAPAGGIGVETDVADQVAVQRLHVNNTLGPGDRPIPRG